MIIGDTELNAQEAITEFKPEPTWMETVKASYDNFTSVNLSHSRQDYYKKEMGDNAVEYSKQDPQNAELYNRISKYAYKDIERLEALYEQGNTKAINNYVQQNPFQADIFLSQDFLQYKELQQKNGFKPQSQITEDINARALRDYAESEDVLKRSDHWTAEMVGTMGGALSDIKTIQTLPLGTFKTGASVLGTAARAMGEEMGIEALAQVSIAPEVYGFKKEIGLNTSIMTEASNALASIATAGMFRGVGSAAYDLTAPGLKALRMKDAKLADDYEATFKGSEVSQSNKDFLDDMHKAEFEDPINMEVSNPSEKGIALNAAEPIPQTKPEILAQVEANRKAYFYQEEAKDITTKPSNVYNLPDDIKDNIYVEEALSNGNIKATDKVGISQQVTRGGLARIDETTDVFIYPVSLPTHAIQTHLSAAKVKRIRAGRGTPEDIADLKEDVAYIEKLSYDEALRDNPFGDNDFMLKTGVDEQGETIYKSFKELQDEHDMTDAYLKKARDCNL
jgi:hypothetical protein